MGKQLPFAWFVEYRLVLTDKRDQKMASQEQIQDEILAKRLQEQGSSKLFYCVDDSEC